MSEHKFPTGWDEERVKRLIAHYDCLTEEEQVAEDEAALSEQNWVYLEARRRRDEMRDASMGISHEETWRRIDGGNG